MVVKILLVETLDLFHFEYRQCNTLFVKRFLCLLFLASALVSQVIYFTIVSNYQYFFLGVKKKRTINTSEKELYNGLKRVWCQWFQLFTLFSKGKKKEELVKTGSGWEWEIMDLFLCEHRQFTKLFVKRFLCFFSFSSVVFRVMYFAIWTSYQYIWKGTLWMPCIICLL